MSPECIPEVTKPAGVLEKTLSVCLEVLQRREVKNVLKRHMDEALEVDAFGLPVIVAHIDGRKEVYFAQDHLQLLAHGADKNGLGHWPELA
ncbi:glutathione S-transferase kappa 1-like [Tropilaelaps mercedesae]|uniref:Glutathione S-transferase kappa 1-like n=1 Tax=Tropilaelaps mercedesae TaxID=418985 RepID=A0A1V9X6S0_9ACAR|nr:glutathione S-transferase kappa 1-like [Tropilaelaps mercedesae]